MGNLYLLTVRRKPISLRACSAPHCPSRESSSIKGQDAKNAGYGVEQASRRLTGTRGKKSSDLLLNHSKRAKVLLSVGEYDLEGMSE